jgi:hypothetical protein
MSKSYPEGCLFLDDPKETIKKKIKTADLTSEQGRLNCQLLCNLFVVPYVPEAMAETRNQLANNIITILDKVRE